MPTREQIAAVWEHLEQIAAPGMSRADLDRAIEGMDFEGFTEAEIHDIERRIVDGEAAEFWMDGIEPQDEMTRLYRVEPIPGGEAPPDWIARGQDELGITAARGRWFVADPALLDWYREDAVGPTRTVSVDVPTADLEAYRVSNSTEQIGPRPVKSYSRDPEREFFLPRALADRARVRDEAEPEGEMAKDDPQEPGIDRPGGRDAGVRELFDTANRVMAARYLEDHALDPGVMLRPAAEVRQIYLGEAEKAWDSFREECQSRTDGEIAEALGQFRATEASLGDTRTLMDHLRDGGLFVDPALDPHAAAAAADGPREAMGERAAAVRPLTQQLIAAAALDVWPGHAAVVDFGIDSERHLGSLFFAIREGLVTPQELDAACGRGAELTAIARRGANPYRDVTFRTSWDEMRLGPEGAGPEAAAAPSETPREGGGPAAGAADRARFQRHDPDRGQDR